MPQHEDHAFYIELAADLQLTQLCEIEKTRKKSRQVQRKQPSQYYHRKHVRDTDFFPHREFGHYYSAWLTQMRAKNWGTF